MIELKNVYVIYKKTIKRETLIALDDFTITINEGDIYGILGAKEDGKTTAMNVMIGLLKPNKGTVLIYNTTPTPGGKIFNEIFFIPEEPKYHNYLTVNEALTYYSSMYKENKSYISRLNELIEYFDLKEFKNMRIEKCSKGMKEKLGLIQCFVNKLRIPFLDEPTHSLDPITVKKLRDIIIELNKNGSTIIINSHVLSEIEFLCNRVAIIHKGKLIKEDKLNNLIPYDTNKYETEFSKTLQPLPEYITIIAQTKDLARGIIPPEHIENFIKISNSILFELTLKIQGLEAYLISIIENKN